jgi:hypothetical protein
MVLQGAKTTSLGANPDKQFYGSAHCFAGVWAAVSFPAWVYPAAKYPGSALFS